MNSKLYRVTFQFNTFKTTCMRTHYTKTYWNGKLLVPGRLQTVGERTGREGICQPTTHLLWTQESLCEFLYVKTQEPLCEFPYFKTQEPLCEFPYFKTREPLCEFPYFITREPLCEFLYFKTQEPLCEFSIYIVHEVLEMGIGECHRNCNCPCFWLSGNNHTVDIQNSGI